MQHVLQDLLHPVAPLRIVLKVFPQKSHLNATFGLARALVEAGHEIVYLGIESQRAHVEAQGFVCEVEASDVYPSPEYRSHQPRLTFWTILRHWREVRQAGRMMRHRFARGDSFDALVERLRPDFLFVDRPYTLFALGLYKHRLPFAMLESMMNLNRDRGCPPLDTTCVPTGSWWSDFWCELHWRRYFVKRWILGQIGLRADFNRTFVYALADTCGVDRSVLNFDRYFHLGLSDMPEILLSNPKLDFPRRPAPNQILAYYPPHLDREEVGGDYRLTKALDRFVAERASGRRLIYCSLGTGGWRYKGAEQFLRKVAESAIGQDYNLLVAIGEDFDLAAFPCNEPNIHVCRYAPQLKVLRHADLMITHGGMNTLNECFELGVPMIVRPGTKEIDQAGNAVRVRFQSRARVEVNAGGRSNVTELLSIRRVSAGLYRAINFERSPCAWANL